MKPIFQDRLCFNRHNGETSCLYITSDSGKIIYRDKVDTIIGIKHPGIILGEDWWGTTWVVHNHYKNGKPAIVSIDDFSEDSGWFYDNRQIFYDPITILSRAISSWNESKLYNWLTNNCQHFVNNVTRNEHKSEAVEQVSDTAMWIGGITFFAGLLSKNKSAMNTGATIFTGGAIGKGISRLK